MSRNLCILVGRLGQDPQLSYNPTGVAILKFSLATSEKYNDKQTGERIEKTEWHNIIVFGKNAENLNNMLYKGSQVYVEGPIQTNKYEKDGETRYYTSIKARTVQVLGSKKDNPNNTAHDNQPMLDKSYNIKEQEQFKTDEIPF